MIVEHCAQVFTETNIIGVVVVGAGIVVGVGTSATAGIEGTDVEGGGGTETGSDVSSVPG